MTKGGGREEEELGDQGGRGDMQRRWEMGVEDGEKRVGCTPAAAGARGRRVRLA